MGARLAGGRNLDTTRWFAMISGLLIMIAVSYAYCWSLFQNPMISERGATPELMALYYTILTVIYAGMTLVSGKIVEKVGIRKSVLMALVAYAIGFVVVGAWQTLGGFVLGALIFHNFQQAIAYVAVYAMIAKLFPDKKGTCMAIVGMGTTGGGIFMAPLAQYFIDTYSFSLQFFWMGGILTILGIVAYFMAIDPPEGYLPKGYALASEEETKDEETGKPGFVQKDWKAMLKDPAFYVLFCIPVFAAVGYMILLFQMSWVAQDIVKVTAAQGAWLVSASTIGSTAGKLVLGTLSDKLGRLNMLPVILGVQGIFLLMLMRAGEGDAIYFMIFAVLTTFCGASMAAFTGPLVSDLFGNKYFPFNFSIVIQAPAIASIIAPWLAAFGTTNGFGFTFAVAGGMSFLAAVLAFVLRKMRNNRLEVYKKVAVEQETTAE